MGNSERHITSILAEYDGKVTGAEMMALMQRLYPICRSITGNGVRQTLNILREQVDLEVYEVPSGSQAFDWTVPPEWNIGDAYIKDASGKRIVDFKQSNLHVLGYSVPVHETMTLEQLRPHLHTLPDQPNTIPYRTSYYKETWGFCLTHNQLQAMDEGQYEVMIDSTLEPGHLTYGELLLPSRSDKEVLISTYLCHPSLCNDNLSGVVIAHALARLLKGADLRYSYRFLFIPETIGAITWLSRNKDQVDRIAHGLIITCAGDRGNMSYKRSRRGNAEIDQAAVNVLEHSGQECQIFDYSPLGSDERQYCSPGFNLPVGLLMRTPYTQFREYHTSDDNLDFVTSDALADTMDKYLRVFDVIERNARYINLNPYCEPQLGKRGLYRSTGGGDHPEFEMAVIWVLNYSDGGHSLLDISDMSGIPFPTIAAAADALVDAQLLKQDEK